VTPEPKQDQYSFECAENCSGWIFPALYPSRPGLIPRRCFGPGWNLSHKCHSPYLIRQALA